MQNEEYAIFIRVKKLKKYSLMGRYFCNELVQMNTMQKLNNNHNET